MLMLMMLIVLRVLIMLIVLIVRTAVLVVLVLSELDRSELGLLSLRVLAGGHRLGVELALGLRGLAPQLFDLSSLDSTGVTWLSPFP